MFVIFVWVAKRHVLLREIVISALLISWDDGYGESFANKQVYIHLFCFVPCKCLIFVVSSSTRDFLFFYVISLLSLSHRSKCKIHAIAVLKCITYLKNKSNYSNEKTITLPEKTVMRNNVIIFW